MAYELTINGIVKEMQPGWTINTKANGRASFRFQNLSSDGLYRPAIDQEVVLKEDGVTVFGGFIMTPSESGLANLPVTPIVTTVEATDYHQLAQRRYVSATIPAGTLKAALQVIVTYLPGATLDATQVDGPALAELVYADVKTEEVLNHLTDLTGYIWRLSATKVLKMYATGSLVAPFNITEANGFAEGDVTVEPTRESYANRVIVRNESSRKTAEDASAAANPWELLVTAPDTLSATAMQDLANAILSQRLPTLKRVRYRSYQSGLEPGMTQTIDLPKRNLLNTFLITDIVTRDFGPLLIARDVTALEGLVYQTGWRETYRKWNSGGTVVAGAGGSGGSTTRYAYFLGGNGIDATRSATPTWMPASGGKTIGQGAVQVQINTVPRGTLSAVVSVRLRALEAGVTVKARLYDVTAGAPCVGESAVVTSTVWEWTTFAVTLNAGSHIYELQVLPGTANKDVLGVGYVE
jgi:hypothetical protein